MPSLSVQVVAIHMHCEACGSKVRISLTDHDAFTEQVLNPVWSWANGHRIPKLAGLETRTQVVTSRKEEP